jgi:hypothetical protein
MNVNEMSTNTLKQRKIKLLMNNLKHIKLRLRIELSGSLSSARAIPVHQ